VIHITLLYDLRAPEPGVPPEALYRAAVEQSAWADTKGFTSVTLTEHHATRDGYLPSPIVLGAAIAGVTSNMQIRLAAILLPLYQPLRLAEDLAVLDLISGGRLRLTVGLGYRAQEYEQLGVDMKRRASIMEDGVETLKRAWSGDPFEYQGRTVQVLPRPAQQPRPAILMGGMSLASARRASRIADGYQPTSPRLYDAYAEESQARGSSATASPQPRLATIGPYFFVSEDPEDTWERIAPFALYDNNEYARWVSERGDPSAFARDATELRRQGKYQVVTPEECLAAASGRDMLVLKPLVGGLDPGVGWESLRLFAEKVMPALRDPTVQGNPVG
jgi:alkanesulfonate monooxygenase SsuD/methylene tetrahydromethanopterin reductase-like flavin-dependent oxidoreductase (luciferase family)